MKAPMIARILGILFVVFGALAFVPWVSPVAPATAPFLELDAAYRLLFGIFPVNAALDVLYVLFGLWGLIAALHMKAAVVYLRSLVWIFLVLVILGVCPLLDTLFGAMPLYGWTVGVHVVVALLAAFGGYGRGSIVSEVNESNA